MGKYINMTGFCFGIAWDINIEQYGVNTLTGWYCFNYQEMVKLMHIATEWDTFINKMNNHFNK